jgi:hypothetical protein
MTIERAMAALVLAAAASISGAVDAPDGLKPSTGEVLTLQSKAAGVQICVCSKRKDDPYTYEWTFNAPEAELRDLDGKRIGRHYGGPTWESDDGSKVSGQVKARDSGPDPSAIPWLLLTATSNSGKGVFAKTTSIQRMDTTGGIAPADGCGPTQEGRVVRVPYTATYYFFSRE